MALIPAPTHTLAGMIDTAHEAAASPPRGHLGASMLGHPCDRYLWLSFRWAVQPRFSGRVLRLFRRGQNEESTVIDDLRMVGISVANTGRDQRNLDFGSHVSGSVDGVILSGVPEAPRKKHILEIKTHNKASFNDLVKKGVVESKPTHHVQMQVYMHGAEIDRALYVAICKDDDSIYTERLRYDQAIAEKAIARGHRIALSDRMPEPISADPSWYQCKLCDAHDFCHNTHLTQHVNCRTCAHSTALPNSTWRCERYQADGIPVDYQRTGCEAHVLHPDMVPWRLDRTASSEWEAVWIIEDTPIRNGEADAFVFASSELIANAALCVAAIQGDEAVMRLRTTMGGRVVG